ncbi:ABC transporter substrate-binding protein [Agromyces luteolus]|uniref:Zinc ABC transporter substrate-binding protein n=1 Tax=Agromyces luteolus TaxID=88373 RepID=A0A7C9LFR3_9MICO|nr:metal ABC transporter substrate-binding protein [Agromyces luteolus]MUN05934.1 zinc ABC transporter substrate-binding protein [Agromyces luteolus]GLK26487.1 ABC transporter substrate-binding protein [Agromyces luteolus]
MPNATPRSIRLSALALGAASVALLAGCATPGASESDGVQVVATTTQVADFAREVAGESAEVTGLLEPGQSAHSFDPSAAQLLALGSADALVVNGAGLESWIDDAVAASGFDGVLIDASTGIELEATDDEHAEGHDHDAEATDEHEDGDHEADEHAAEEHAEDEHAHDDGNPHIWTDPVLAERMVANIAAGLGEVPGIDAEAIGANAEDYTARLQALDAWIEENVATVPVEERLLVTNHDAFTYFLHAYDITFVGSVIPSFDDNAEPSAAEIDELVERIAETGVQAVFSEASISPKAAETIADEAGVAVYSGEDALYGDSLGQPGSDGETYLGSQVHNVTLILESWGVEPSPSPAVLGG